MISASLPGLFFTRPDPEHLVYIEFRIGDYQHELGIIDSKYASKNAKTGPRGVRLQYWQDDNIPASLEKAAAMVTKECEPLTKTW